MKKSSKVISVLLAVLMAASCFMGVSLLGASAAEDTTIYFELPETIWGLSNTESGLKVYCHIWSIANDDEFKGLSWQVSGERCTYDADKKLWAYDMEAKLDGQTMKEGADYGVIFSAKNKKGTIAAQTFNITMAKECYGDTLYVVDTMYENPEDSSQKGYGGFWRGDTEHLYGPQKTITSKGELAGEYWPAHQAPSDAIANFIKSQPTNIEAAIAEGNYCCVTLCEQLNTNAYEVYTSYSRIYAADLAAEEVTIPTLDKVCEYLKSENPPKDPNAQVVDTNTYVVAGTTSLCGSEWIGNDEANVMTAQEDGTYVKVFENVAPVKEAQFKVVVNAEDGSQDWVGIGDNNAFNCTINVNEACDVTVTYNPETKEITVTGDAVTLVTSLDVEAMYIVGNGDGAYLNGVAWDPAAEANKMTEVSEGVYTCTNTMVPQGDDYEFKFAANGSWANNWAAPKKAEGDPDTVVDVETGTFAGVYNGDNLHLDLPYEFNDVTYTLDLTNFDYLTKEGATIKVDITPAEPPVTVYKYGDVNMDGVVNVADATMVQRIAVELISATPEQAELADVNADGRVSVLDVTLIQMYSAEVAYKNIGRTGQDAVSVEIPQ